MVCDASVGECDVMVVVGGSVVVVAGISCGTIMFAVGNGGDDGGVIAGDLVIDFCWFWDGYGGWWY